ncbi:MAG: indolepyruvate oxidoreductase subunit beta [Candidatus Brocadiia bacterium]
MTGVTNVLISGVGGQGTILASDILSEAALEAGFDVKKSEIHGMAQRGGTVVSQVRFGPKVYSPIIPEGDVHYFLAFELVESLRFVQNVRADGAILVNEQIIPSSTILAGLDEYPADPLEGVSSLVRELTVIPAAKAATELGNPRVANVILLGALAKRTGLPLDAFRNAIRRLVKPRFVDLNLKAFEKGLSY